MKPFDLYIYLPNEYNFYNQCHCLSEHTFDEYLFYSKLQILYKAIKYFQVEHIYYVGCQPMLNKYILDILHCFDQYKQVILTSGINLSLNLDKIIPLVKSIDICRLSLNEQENKKLFNNQKVLTINEIEQITFKCHSKKVKTRIIVPIHQYYHQDLLKLIDMSKYLYSDIVFRNISLIKQPKHSIYSFFQKYPTVYIQNGDNYDLIIKRLKDINVWIENIVYNVNQYNEDYLVYHPNGTLNNSFRNRYVEKSKWKYNQ